MNDNTQTLEQRELAIADGVQAPLVNRFCLRVTSHVVRFVAFETYDTPVPRCACNMSIDDALELYRALGEALSKQIPGAKGH